MLRIGRLTVENLTKECVTDNPRPRFSYYLESDRENVSLKSAVIRMNGWKIGRASCRERVLRLV